MSILANGCVAFQSRFFNHKYSVFCRHMLFKNGQYANFKIDDSRCAAAIGRQPAKSSRSRLGRRTRPQWRRRHWSRASVLARGNTRTASTRRTQATRSHEASSLRRTAKQPLCVHAQTLALAGVGDFQFVRAVKLVEEQHRNILVVVSVVRLLEVPGGPVALFA